jgi:hypothetical protein
MIHLAESSKFRLQNNFISAAPDAEKHCIQPYPIALIINVLQNGRVHFVAEPSTGGNPAQRCEDKADASTSWISAQAYSPNPRQCGHYISPILLVVGAFIPLSAGDRIFHKHTFGTANHHYGSVYALLRCAGHGIIAFYSKLHISCNIGGIRTCANERGPLGISGACHLLMGRNEEDGWAYIVAGTGSRNMHLRAIYILSIATCGKKACQDSC